MRYVALLRGINVGGRSKVEMPRLKRVLEGLGFADVSTYINSGNAIFSTRRTAAPRLAERIEGALESELGRPIRVLVLPATELARIAEALPADWAQDGDSLCNVLFLWPEVDRPAVLDELPAPNPEVEEVRYVRGAVFHRRDAALASRARAGRIVGTDLYRSVTSRNANTVRKLHELARRP